MRTLLRPRNALSCVGLVVLGGCLTFIITPDESGTEADSSSGEFPTIVLDPGHGGRDEGTKWHGVAEKQLTLDVALRAERLLRSNGFNTILTRRDDTYIPLDERARIANSLKNALFVSVHFNSERTTSTTGVETYFAKEKDVPAASWTWVGFFNRKETGKVDSSDALAGAIHTSVLGRTEGKDRGIHPVNYYVVHHTACPAVLVEGGYLSNTFESQLLSTEPYRELIAQGIAEGVLRYLQNRPPEKPEGPITASRAP